LVDLSEYLTKRR